MGYTKTLLYFGFITYCYFFGLPIASGNNTLRGCGDQAECLRCAPAGCMKCPQYIVFETRKCVDECPSGHSVKWSRLVDYMGQVCFNTGSIWGMSSEAFAIVVGIGVGAVVCCLIIVIGLIYVKYRKRNVLISMYDEDSPEKRDFLKQLEMFRPHAYTFLDMLNDTRRQIRELHRSGDHTGIAAYKPVVRDLAKILVLLNRSPEQIPEVPNDWERLSAWAEKVLKRYKRLSDATQPQMAQLISFLQTPSYSTSRSSRTEPQSQFTTMSTFKPDHSVAGSNPSLQNDAVQNLNSFTDNQLTGTLNPSWQFPNYSLISLGNTNWNHSREYLNSGCWVDDDFMQLGYRPQDEITTEL